MFRPSANFELAFFPPIVFVVCSLCLVSDCPDFPRKCGVCAREKRGEAQVENEFNRGSHRSLSRAVFFSPYRVDQSQRFNKIVVPSLLKTESTCV